MSKSDGKPGSQCLAKPIAIAVCGSSTLRSSSRPLEASAPHRTSLESLQTLRVDSSLLPMGTVYRPPLISPTQLRLATLAPVLRMSLPAQRPLSTAPITIMCFSARNHLAWDFASFLAAGCRKSGPAQCLPARGDTCRMQVCFCISGSKGWAIVVHKSCLLSCKARSGSQAGLRGVWGYSPDDRVGRAS